MYLQIDTIPQIRTTKLAIGSRTKIYASKKVNAELEPTSHICTGCIAVPRFVVLDVVGGSVSGSATKM